MISYHVCFPHKYQCKLEWTLTFPWFHIFTSQAAAISAASRRAIFSKSRSRSSHLTDLSSSFNLSDLQNDIKDQSRLQRRGAEFAIATLARHFEGDLPTSLGPIWQAVVGPLHQHVDLTKFGKYSVLKGKPHCPMLYPALQEGDTHRKKNVMGIFIHICRAKNNKMKSLQAVSVSKNNNTWCMAQPLSIQWDGHA